MPRTATALKDELLPAIFRRLRQAVVPGQGQVDDYITAQNDPLRRPHLQGEGEGGVAFSNVLAPQDQSATLVTQPKPVVEQPAPAPLTIVPSAPAVSTLAAGLPAPVAPIIAKPVVNPVETNVLAPEPMVSRSGQVMNEDATRARRVETNDRGRPIRNVALRGDEQTLDYNSRLAAMPEDKEGGGWWPKIRAAITGFAVGGPVGAAAAFGTRALREHMDPTLGSREYRAQEMGRLAPAVATIQKNRKDVREEQRLDTQNAYTVARTKALTDPKAKPADIRLVSRKTGVYAVNPATGESKKVDEIPAEAGSPASARYFSTDAGVYKVDEAHPNGVRVHGIPGKKGKDVEDVTFSNSQIQKAIAEAKAEQQKLDEGLVGVPRTIEGVDPLTGVRKQVANPDYTYNMTRRRQLDDHIRNWELKLKSPKKPAASKEDDPLGLFDEDE